MAFYTTVIDGNRQEDRYSCRYPDIWKILAPIFLDIHGICNRPYEGIAHQAEKAQKPDE